MQKRIVFRTDSRDLKPGDELVPLGNHYGATLDASHHDAEQKIRAGHPQGTEAGTRIRSQSIYVWDNQGWAERTWHLQKKQPLVHLYALEIHLDDTLHVGDLDHYTAVSTALGTQQPADQHIKNYWSGHIVSRKVERLVNKAKVLQKLIDKNEKRDPFGGFKRITDDELESIVLQHTTRED
jgi:hypothetical protein